jgi:hypothetical protein
MERSQWALVTGQDRSMHSTVRSRDGQLTAGGMSGKAGFQMMKGTVGLAVVSAALALGVVLQASDMVGIYGVVEKVTFEPSEKSPERIQVWGAFSFAEAKNGSAYGPVERGYLYYSCPSRQESICRKEWADLKSVAGKSTAVGFGMRYKPTGRIRKADEKVASPDPYPIQMGVILVENASDRGSDTMKVIDGLRAAVKQR